MVACGRAVAAAVAVKDVCAAGCLQVKHVGGMHCFIRYLHCNHDCMGGAMGSCSYEYCTAHLMQWQLCTAAKQLLHDMGGAMAR
jgi:hypothetical protein